MINLDYPFIVAWGRWLMSLESYTNEQVLLARSAGAPHDAIDRNDDGTWSRLSDILLPDVRQHIINLAGEYLDSQRSLVMDLLRQALDDEDTAREQNSFETSLGANTYRRIEQALGDYR